MLFLQRHRALGEIDKKIRQGKSLIFVSGEAIRENDNYFYSLEHGIQDLASTLRLFYLSPQNNYDYFLHVRHSLDHIDYYQKTAAGILQISAGDFMAPPKTEGILDLDGPADNQSDDASAGQRENAGNIAANAGNPVSATAERLRAAIIQKNASRVMLFFDNLQWIARLHDSPQETRVLSFLLNDCARMRNVTAIASIPDIRLLENYVLPGDELYIGKPTADEIYYAFFRYLLRHPSRVNFEPDILDRLAHGLGAGKKKLNDCLRILKRVLQKRPESLRLEDFEESFEKGIEEKVAWADVRLDRKIKEEIEKVVNEFVNQGEEAGSARRGLLMWGPPGTGKTMIAKALANEKKCHFMAPTLAELKGEYVGQSSAKIRAIFAEARANEPTILFIDEADTVFPSRDNHSDRDSFGMDMVNQFLQEIDGATTGRQKVFVIAATNREHAIDNAIKSRLGGAYEIRLPDKETRLAIFDDNLQRLQKDRPFSLKRAAFQDEVLDKSEGMSGRDIENFTKTLVYHRRSPLAYDEETRNLFLERFGKEEEDVFSTLKREVFSCGEILSPEDAQKTAIPLIGLKGAREALERQAQFIASPTDNKSRYHAFKVETPKGILLYGPPGNGKSALAKWVAARHNFYFFKVLSKDFVKVYPQDQIERLEKIFYEPTRFSKMMQARGIVLFFDEFDSLAHRDYMDHSVRGALLHYLTDRSGIRNPNAKIMFVAATNFENDIDDAVKRAGRIDLSVYIPNPSKEEGLEILEQMAARESDTLQVARAELAAAWEILHKSKCAKADRDWRMHLAANAAQDIKKVLAMATLPSGAELENLFNELKYAAMQKDSFKDGKLLISRDILNFCFPERSRAD